MSRTNVLFQPMRIKSMELPNRIVMAPMTRGFATDGFVGPSHIDYYRRRSEGGVGLILTEGVVVERPGSQYEPHVPLFYGKGVEDWRPVVDAVHAGGGRIAPQLWHTGAARSHTAVDWEPRTPVESPSGLLNPGESRGVVMSEEDIADTIAAFGRAAADAKRLGFDCVEIHGAHGYLIDQFFWSGTNLREDRYGGATLRERSRFAAEIVAAIREAVGPDYPIILRVSQWKQQDLKARLVETPDAMADWLVPLVDAGVDVLHCSQRRFWTPEFPEVDGEDGLNFAGWAKKLTGAKTISVGSVGLSGDFLGVFQGQDCPPASLDRLVERMERGEFDLIAVGRALIVDPQWADKVRRGELDAMIPFSSESLADFT